MDIQKLDDVAYILEAFIPEKEIRERYEIASKIDSRRGHIIVAKSLEERAYSLCAGYVYSGSELRVTDRKMKVYRALVERVIDGCIGTLPYVALTNHMHTDHGHEKVPKNMEAMLEDHHLDHQLRTWDHEHVEEP